MPRTYNSGDVSVNQPIRTSNSVINKFLTLAGVKLAGKIPVYYADKKRQPKWKMNKLTGEYHPKSAYITVDYDNNKREWYVGYIATADDRKFCTINDLTGDCSITT